MNADPQLHDRLSRAIESYELEVEDAWTAVASTVRVRQRRRRLGAMVVAAAIVGGLGLAGWLEVAHQSTTPQPVDAPTRYVPPSPPGGVPASTEIAPLPQGAHPTHTPAEIKRYALALIAHDEQELGRALVPARIISIRFVAGGDDPGPSWGPGQNLYDSWVVEFEGTRLACGWWCTGHLGGTLLFSDYGPGERSMFEQLDPAVCLVQGRGEPPQSQREVPTC